jgi:PHP family Zn ribbon phosphoesterase
MSYNDKYGITEVFKRKAGDSFETLSISWDYETNEENRNERAAVLLHVPREDNYDHSHIVLNVKQAKTLRDWLDSYIKDLEEHGVAEITHFLAKGSVEEQK